MTAPVLVFAWGNPSRGDDALGPEFAARFEQALAQPIARGEVEVLTDYQLQVEHALDLADRRLVLFVDAIAGGKAPWALHHVAPARDASFTTHALSPASLLHAYETVVKAPAPDSWLLTIRGEQFELGAPMSEAARHNLDAALEGLAGRLPLSGANPA